MPCGYRGVCVLLELVLHNVFKVMLAKAGLHYIVAGMCDVINVELKSLNSRYQCYIFKVVLEKCFR